MIAIETKEHRNHDVTVTIKISTFFTSDDQQELLKLEKPKPNTHYILDLDNLRMLDSGGVGILLSFYGRCNTNSDFSIINSNNIVLNVLYCSCLYSLFQMPQINSDSFNGMKVIEKLKRA